MKNGILLLALCGAPASAWAQACVPWGRVPLASQEQAAMAGCS